MPRKPSPPKGISGAGGKYIKKPPTADRCMGYLGGHPGRAGDGYCARQAGEGTDHPGEGRCYLHRGNARVTTGLKSTLCRYHGHTVLGVRIQKAADDANLLSLRDEVALAQANLEDFVEQHADERFEGDERKQLLGEIALLASIKEKAHKISLAWTDRRAEEFLDWIGQAVAKALEKRDIDRQTVGLVLQDLADMAEKFRV